MPCQEQKPMHIQEQALLAKRYLCRILQNCLSELRVSKVVHLCFEEISTCLGKLSYVWCQSLACKSTSQDPKQEDCIIVNLAQYDSISSLLESCSIASKSPVSSNPQTKSKLVPGASTNAASKGIPCIILGCRRSAPLKQLQVLWQFL